MNKFLFFLFISLSLPIISPAQETPTVLASDKLIGSWQSLNF